MSLPHFFLSYYHFSTITSLSLPPTSTTYCSCSTFHSVSSQSPILLSYPSLLSNPQHSYYMSYTFFFLMFPFFILPCIPTLHTVLWNFSTQNLQSFLQYMHLVKLYIYQVTLLTLSPIFNLAHLFLKLILCTPCSFCPLLHCLWWFLARTFTCL